MADNEHNSGNAGQSQAHAGGLEQARQAAENLGDRARELGGSAAEQARHYAQAARDQAEAGAAALGSGMRNLADTLRQRAPHEGMMGTAASGLADSLERGSHYLEQEGINGLAEDLSTLVRRNPLPAVLIGVGVGFLFAQMFSRSER